jgi:hypothetical protein
MTFAAASSQYLAATAEFAALRTTASMSFWIKTTQVGNDTFYEAPGIAGIEESGGGDDIFWGWIDNNAGSSRLLMRKGDAPDVLGPVINTGVEFHVVMTWDSATGANQMFINGVLYATSTTGTGDVTNVFYRIASIEDTGATPTYFDGLLDDVRIYNRILSAAEISALFAQHGGDDVREGLVTRYKMDEGYPGQTASGTVYDDTANNDATATASPTYAESTIMRRRAA